MRGDNPRTTRSGSGHHNPARFPNDCIGQFPGRRGKGPGIRGAVIGLDHILCVLPFGIAPPAELDVELPMILIHARIVPCKYAKHSCGFQTGSIFNSERIGSIPQTSRQVDFRTRPAPVSIHDSKMERSLRIGGDIAGIVRVAGAPAVARRCPYSPAKSAEIEKHRRGGWLTRGRRNSSNLPAGYRQLIQSCGGNKP